MPKVRMGERSASVLHSAALAYQAELAEIISGVERQAQATGADAEAYLPRDVKAELELAGYAVRFASHAMEDDNVGLFGANVREDALQTMAAALALHREGLAARLLAVQADPLAHSAEGQVLQDEIARIDGEFSSFWCRYGLSPRMHLVKDRLLLKQGLRYPAPVPLEAALAAGEGQQIEFIDRFPDQARELAREVAAFATSNPGTIFLGIANDGSVVGLAIGSAAEERDKLRVRIEGVCSNGVRPAVPAQIDYEDGSGAVVVRLRVPRGPEPVYYVDERPYVRHGSTSRPAQPEEVKRLIQEWAARPRD